MATRGQNEEDRKSALHELADQFGEGVGNAEELINANAERRTAELNAIQSLPIIQDQTNEIDLDKVKVSGEHGDHYVVDAAWRGSGRTRGLVAIVEDEVGRQHKVLVESNYDDRHAAGPRRSSHAKNEQDEAGKDSSKKAESK